MFFELENLVNVYGFKELSRIYDEKLLERLHLGATWANFIFGKSTVAETRMYFFSLEEFQNSKDIFSVENTSVNMKSLDSNYIGTVNRQISCLECVCEGAERIVRIDVTILKG